MSGIKRTKEDIEFSRTIRKRDNWMCQRCGSYKGPDSGPKLHCAHYFTRRTRATRFDPMNALALCYGCHQFVDSHAAEKEALWRLRIGNEAFDALTLRAHRAGKEIHRGSTSSVAGAG